LENPFCKESELSMKTPQTKTLYQTLDRSFAPYRWLAVVTAAILLAACQPIHSVTPTASDAAAGTTTEATAESSAGIPQITIKAKDYSFDMPDELPAGLVSLTFTNEGKVNHHGYVARLLEGVTLDQVLAAATADTSGQNTGQEPPKMTDVDFFLPDTDPGKSNQATVELAPGKWFIISFSMDPASGDSTPDFAKGSIKEFTVTESDASAVAPEADVTVTIAAKDFDMPAEVTAGTHTIQVVNNSGADDGYIFFVKLGGDTTVESTLAAFQQLFAGQQPDKMPDISTVGGLMGYSVGDSYYTTINFEPGNYAAISSINGEDFPYAGLYKNFTVK
jgi:hypothetical protein